MQIPKITMNHQKPLNKLQIIKQTIVKGEKLKEAQLQMAKKHQI